MGSFFNSPKLARYLKKNGTDCVGTLRPTREEVPIAVQKCPLREGEFVARHAGDVMTVAIQNNRSRTTCISTCHDVSQVVKTENRRQPISYLLALADDFNHNMGGVDLMDQKLEAYLIERKQCLQWSKKMFKRILNITVQNARILLEKTKEKSIGSLAFRLELAGMLMERHLARVPRAVRAPVRRNGSLAPRRLVERHFISHVVVTEEMKARVKHNAGRYLCAWCKKKRSIYECKSCEVPLCVRDCFEKYHTVATVPDRRKRLDKK
ncbi:transposase IS4 domain-containing protein [Phthorimaea operculella]|nr:transposase IS4 domain-containing protein [Phthorimaea operculella]